MAIKQTNNSSQPLIDRKLPQRSFLKFYFPLPESGANGRYYVVNLPFFENIEVRESKKARYQRYSLISRSSNLYTYMGADSRLFSLDFNITLPHLLDLHPEAKQLTDFSFVYGDLTNKKKEQDKFKSPVKAAAGVGSESIAYRLGNFYTKEQVSSSLKEVFKSTWYKSSNLVDQQLLISRYKNAMNAEAFKDLGIDLFDFDFTNIADIKKLIVTSSSKDIATLTFKSELQKADKTIDEAALLRYKMIDLIVYWTNIIRSSVVNNSDNPMYGPPLLRLRHGIMYQDVPCICTDYSIQANEAAGYDIDTLLPRQLKISLKLEELRTGSFGKFNPTSSNIVERDNLAGWESVILGPTTSMDPGLGGFGVDGP